MRHESGDLGGLATVVSGGTGAIGSSVCLEFARRGAAVAVLYRSDSVGAAELVSKLRSLGASALAHRCDVTDPTSLAQAFDAARAELGPLSIAVHSANAKAVWRSIVDLSDADWQSYVAIGLNGAFNFLRAALTGLSGERDKSIVLVSSIAAVLFPIRNAQSAAVSAAVEALVRVAAREQGRNGFRINGVSIGLTESPATHEAFAAWGETAAAKAVKDIPLQRIGQPGDAARAVAFLAGRDASYVTGKILRADGGQYIGL